MLMILSRERLIETEATAPLIAELEEQSKMLFAFMRSLRK